MKTRIIKRTFGNGRISYVIQQTHFLFWWWWVDAWVNSRDGANCIDFFDTLEKAKRNLHYFKKGVIKEEVIKFCNTR